MAGSQPVDELRHVDTGSPSVETTIANNLYIKFRSRFFPYSSQAFLEFEDGRVFTYAQLEEVSGRYACRLHQLGLRKGDRLLSQIDKTPEAVFLYLACLRAGILYVPLNTAYQPGEVAYFLADSNPKAVVCHPEYCGTMAKLAAREGVFCVLTLGGDASGSFSEGIDGMDAHSPEVSVALDDPCLMLYTSGTTGRSKGALLTHGQLWTKASALSQLWGWQHDDVLLHTLPIFHSHGLCLQMHTVLASGASMLFQSRFNAENAVGLLPRSTVFTGIPTMYSRLLADPALGAETCRNMRLFISASAPLSVENFNRFRERTGHTILECWGTTETLTNASNPLVGERRAGSVGRPVPAVELRIVDRERKPLPAGQPGAIEVRTEPRFPGYWNKPEETRDVVLPDGFFVTGDIGILGEDGVLSIIGRTKDMIISGGYNIYPKEVETAIAHIDGVADSAVIGVPDTDFGECVIAVIECTSNRSSLSESMVIGRLKREMARFKVPKRVLIVDALPRNELGKVQKNVLREQYKNIAARDSGGALSAGEASVGK
jgi:malonyl-CoA/methylmalonyl-CoA synthetase